MCCKGVLELDCCLGWSIIFLYYTLGPLAFMLLFGPILIYARDTDIPDSAHIPLALVVGILTYISMLMPIHISNNVPDKWIYLDTVMVTVVFSAAVSEVTLCIRYLTYCFSGRLICLDSPKHNVSWLSYFFLVVSAVSGFYAIVCFLMICRGHGDAYKNLRKKCCAGLGHLLARNSGSLPR